MAAESQSQILKNLFDGINNNNDQQIAVNLDKLTDLALTNENGENALIYASKYRSNVVIRELVAFILKMCSIKQCQKDILLNQIDNAGNTALMYACKNGYHDVVGQLIMAGARVNIANPQGETALINTITMSVPDTYYSRIDHNIVAMKKIDPHIYDVLVDKHVFDKKLEYKENNVIKIFDLIFRPIYDEKPDTNHRDNSGRTPLILTITEYNIYDPRDIFFKYFRLSNNIVEYLIKHRADPNIQDNDGKTPLMHALITPIIDQQTQQIDPENIILFEDTPRAIPQKNIKLIEQLIKAGAKLDAVDNNGKSVLDYADEHLENGRRTLEDIRARFSPAPTAGPPAISTAGPATSTAGPAILGGGHFSANDTYMHTYYRQLYLRNKSNYLMTM